MARALDPDINPWDQQPDETDQAYAAFLSYRDAEERKVAPQTMTQSEQSMRKRWSAIWVWSYRARAWDRQLAAEDLEVLARSRSKMHRRHREVAQDAQAKFVEWLKAQTPEKVAAWRPTEAVRVWRIAVQIEREATGMAFVEDGALPELPLEVAGEERGPASLSELFGMDPALEAALSDAVYGVLYRDSKTG